MEEWSVGVLGGKVVVPLLHYSSTPLPFRSSCFHTRHRDDHDAFFAAGKPKMLAGGGFHADLIRAHAHRARKIGLHRRDVGRKFGFLGNDHRIHIVDPATGLPDPVGAFPDDDQAVHVFALGIAGWVELPNIAQRQRAEQRISHRVRQHIGVAVPGQPAFMRHRHTADDAFPVRRERMHVNPNPNAIHGREGYTKSAAGANLFRWSANHSL